LSTPLGRLGPTFALACAEPPDGGGDEGPSSETRPLEAAGPPRILRVFMCVREPEPEGAWLTVTDDAGKTHFEGPLSADDAVEVDLAMAPSLVRVKLQLETVRGHRQADVLLNEGLTEHVFV
jgi:hypothetical protein